jgi:hypothetical protein
MIVLVWFLSFPLAIADYRAYQYLTYTKPSSQSSNATSEVAGQIITSTLNPVAFQAYHGGSLQKVELLRSWMCVGYTGARQGICSHPAERP